MSDPSTREQIRAEAIERLAVGQFGIDEHAYSSPTMPARAWDAVPERVRQRYRADAEPLADALGELLPTGEIWGYGGSFAPPVMDNLSEEEARASDRTVWRRYKHDWTKETE
ncbi:hypothetical protein [Nocardia spumae]|uniref:hypothetical protein n=1 Tax=Nocardia spumae TaxID=2887190 RepID=UPI001D15C2FF|nr:hypothetical protein [Nocardia spumae]